MTVAMRHEYRQHWLNVPTRRQGAIVPASRHRLNLANHRRGMTLIEIMVVVGIIAILATLVVWGGGRFIDDAKIKETQQILSGLQNAVVAYKDETGNYPASPYTVDCDDLFDGTRVVPRFRSIPAVNPDESTTERVDFYQSLDPTTDRDNKLGSATSATPNPALVPMICGRTGPCQDDDGDGKWEIVASGTKVYGIQMLIYKLMMNDKTSSHVTKLPEELRVSPGTTKFPYASMPKADVAEFLGDYDTNDELYLKVRSAEVILDAWNRPIYYGWHQNVNNGIPFLQSAGPDGLWDLRPMGGTAISEDDVYSFQKSQ